MVAPAMSAAREEILTRIRAVDRGDAPPAPRAYRRRGTLSTEERVARFCERASDYRADVRRIREGDISGAMAEAFAGRGATRVGIPPGLPAEWRPAGVELIEDGGMSPRELDALDGVATGCTVAIAETGTVVLAAGPAEGRRALTLVPDLHVCVVVAQQIVELVPEAIAALGPAARPLTLVSGPSATSDIELSRVEGVHGPRNLVLIVAEKEAP
jgi:L-lactate dehydrogenase complex protein LldG